MKKGKISESILRRSVLRFINTKREEVIKGAGIGNDCAFLAWQNSEMEGTGIPNHKTEGLLAAATETVTLPVKEAGRYALIAAVNNLAAGGAEAFAAMVSIVLPAEAREDALKELMRQIEAVCRELKIQIAGGHTEVSESVNQPVVTVTALGKSKPIKKGCHDGQLDLVMTKWIGLEGTVILAKEKEKELLTRYPLPFLKAAQRLERYLITVPEAATALRSDVYTMHDIRNGGVFAALWELSKSMGVGLSIDLKQIPVKQETIEICEFFDLNPYELLSGGSLLLTTGDGKALVKELAEAGIHSAVIGKTTNGNNKIVMNEDETRFLEPAKPDEIYKINFKMEERKDE